MDKQIVTVIALGCLVALGCGSKSSNTPSDTGGTSGGSGGTSAATGGTTGSAGHVTLGGASGTAPTEVLVPCGNTMCASSTTSNLMMMGGFMLASACCADESTSTCGATSADPSMTGGKTCLVSPPAAPKCPMAFGMAACCVESNNICGIDGTLAGRGCIDPDAIAAMAPAGFQMIIKNFLPPRTMCDGTLAPVDAGMPMGTGGSSAMTGEDAGL